MRARALTPSQATSALGFPASSVPEGPMPCEFRLGLGFGDSAPEAAD